MKQIKFKTFGANSAFGAFEPGQTMRLGDDLAAHLVNEAGVAAYVGAAPAEAEKVTKQPAAKTAKKK